ncbi:Hypothetical protein ORPV_1077 [Orpheovirus IHUMI-LCC2]|uniref:Uncharacterized protein n=1 Tax=Orpheovirus IHUMI-LCC2 TaxID=2023057 RepID=A0A2I2L632_9VIRU|nr:Hypothetical protein ORPV_1077 [Orpheovirus IHUMI-LCC2]SNW62981.1 Hypothetical protein ORPV_1077 [Orpheovirus IHUMI-LCC2]
MEAKLLEEFKKSGICITSYSHELLKNYMKEEELDTLIKNIEKGYVGKVNKFICYLYFMNDFSNVSYETVKKYEVKLKEMLGLKFSPPNVSMARPIKELKSTSLTEEEREFYKYILSLVLVPTEYITPKGLITINFNVDILSLIYNSEIGDEYIDKVDTLMDVIYDDLIVLNNILYIQNC